MDLLNLWINNREFFFDKTVDQVLSICGSGELTDDSQTSAEFRKFLYSIPTSILNSYADYCINHPFKDSGFVLQDIVNEMGRRLGFSVENGRYRGRQKAVGFDGIWTAEDGYSMVVEVKTTDHFRIPLSKLAEYRSKLVAQNRITEEQSSVLIIVGREDTGDMEAQIRGSKHAWDMRLISIDALIKMVLLKESLNDDRTMLQINGVLRPMEYTKLDYIISLIFCTSEDIKEIPPDDFNEESDDKATPVSFNEECSQIIAKRLKVIFKRHNRTCYSTPDGTIHIACMVSKEYQDENRTRYWFSFHPSQEKFLEQASSSFVVLGCGSKDKLMVFPFNEFKPFLETMGVTNNGIRFYWHVKLYNENNSMFLDQKGGREQFIDVSSYLLK